VRRIDLLLANVGFRHLVRGCKVAWDSGFATHATQTITLDVALPGLAPIWCPAKTLPSPREEGDLLAACGAMPGQLAAAHCTMAGDCIEAAWAALSSCIDSMYERAGLAAAPTGERQGCVKQWRPGPALTPGGDTANTLLRFHLRRWRRLREVCRVWPAFPVAPSQHAFCIWKAIRQAEARSSLFTPLLAAAATHPDLVLCCRIAQHQYEEAAAAARAFRRDRWHQWCNDTEHRAKVFRWVRATPPIPTTVVGDVVTGTPAQRLDEAHQWWSKLWDPDIAPNPDTSHFGQCLADYEACPEMPPLTGHDIQAVLRVSPSAKAAGHDGWRYDEIKSWPEPIIFLMAAFYGTVERCGCWPKALSTALVALLPKGTTGAASDYRPIMLLSVIYRIWAKARGAFMQGYLRSVGIMKVGPVTAAEQLATDLAWRMLLSRAGVIISGIAVDWSKCYDHVSCALLRKLARLCRMPASLYEPMLAAYAMQRHILLNGMLGPVTVPARSMAAGCPRATDWMAMMAHVLVRELQARVPGTLPRPYVDDLTADIEHTDDDDGRELAVTAVADMEAVVQQYAAAWALEANTSKSRRFSTAAPVRASMAAAPGFSVTTDFKDLGVIQTTTDQAAPSALGARDDEAFRRLHRAEILPLPLAVRAMVVAASPGSVGAYGLAAQPISDLRLRTLRSATFRAVWRSPGPSAPELVFELMVPWRCDPGFLACTKPLLALRSGLLCDTIPGDRLADIWHLQYHAGPLRAVHDACRRLGVTLISRTWEIVGPVTIPLLTTPLAQISTFLGRAWFRAGRAKLASRRPALAHLIGELDHYAFRTAMRDLPTESRRASLRVLAADGAITQARASHWVPGGKTCPHCNYADETVHHRLWECPAWQLSRLQHMRGWTEAGLAAHLPAPTMVSGILPVQPHLAVAQAAAELAIALPPPQALSGTVHCDGSCQHPQDPWLSRAAWAVAGPVEEQRRILAVQRVSGTQTIGRAELSALVWLTHCSGTFAVVTDCLYLQLRFESLRSRRMPHHWKEGINGDLWRLVRRTDIVVTWIPSHMDEADVVGLGYLLSDWAGNLAADAAAGACAAASCPPPCIVTAREQQLLALAVVHQVIALVEETVLACHHAPEHPIAKRRKRRKRLTLHRPKRRARLRPKPPAAAPAPAQCGVHSLAIAHGPFRAAPAAQGHFSWKLSCTACHKGVTGTSRWRAFAISLCTALPGAIHLQRSSERHDLVRCVGGWYCARCRLAVASSRHASAARAACPVPSVANGAGAALPGTCAAYCHNLAAILAWRVWASCPSPAHVVPAAAAPLGAAPAAGPLLVWRAHWLIKAQHTGNVQDVCLRCGAWSTRRAPRHVRATACALGPPVSALRGAAKAALLAGSLDAALNAAPAPWQDQAVLLGWTPLRGA
jgi:hypothetical protein